MILIQKVGRKASIVTGITRFLPRSRRRASEKKGTSVEAASILRLCSAGFLRLTQQKNTITSDLVMRQSGLQV